MKNLKKNAQLLGRSMLVPIAAMPLAGLVLRLSSDDLLNLPIIGAAGNAVFGNMDMLFAIGIALGFTKVKDKGLVALTAILGLYTFKNALLIMNEDIKMGIFAGIITGLLSSYTFNRFKDQVLPNSLAFFAKERFPLTMIMIIMSIVAFPVGIIWPVFQNGLDTFAQSLVGMGALGVGIFLFLNRMLIPFGLHHVLNSYIYFELGSYTLKNGDVITGEIPRFIAGDPSAGLFLSGFFIIMMFGIPGICAAIYKCAYPKNKERVKGAMISGAITSFTTNITEPVEFSFMFVAPVLYVVHALYTGLAGIIAYMLNIHLGFSFGACIVDFILNFKIGINSILIIPIGFIFFFLYYFTFSYIIKKYNYNTMGREEDLVFDEAISDNESNYQLKSSNYEYMAKKILQALGHKENIVDVFSCNTRLRVEVKDPSLVDVERIKQTGVAGVIKVSDVDYQIIIGLEVTYVMEEFLKQMEV